MISGYGATPFTLDGDETTLVYMSTDGYLYASGFGGDGCFGVGNTSDYSYPVKVGTNTTGGASSTTFKNPIDYSIGGHGVGMIIDSTGKVWTAGYNGYGGLGQGDTTTDYFFTKVSTGLLYGKLFNININKKNQII